MPPYARVGSTVLVLPADVATMSGYVTQSSMMTTRGKLEVVIVLTLALLAQSMRNRGACQATQDRVHIRLTAAKSMAPSLRSRADLVIHLARLAEKSDGLPPSAKARLEFSSEAS